MNFPRDVVGGLNILNQQMNFNWLISKLTQVRWIEWQRWKLLRLQPFVFVPLVRGGVIVRMNVVASDAFDYIAITAQRVCRTSLLPWWSRWRRNWWQTLSASHASAATSAEWRLCWNHRVGDCGAACDAHAADSVPIFRFSRSLILSAIKN